MNKNNMVVMFQTGNVDGFITMSQKTFWYEVWMLGKMM